MGHWARDLDVLSLSQAIKKITLDPGKLFGIQGRGEIKVGNWADLLLFDPTTVSRGEITRVYDLPAKGSRLTTPSIGVRGVWVNGKRIVDESGLIDKAPMAGKLLRNFDS